MLNDSQQAKLRQLTNSFTEIPFNRMLGLRLVTLDAEHAMMNFSMKSELIGNYLHGILHGGVISSVLDMAGGMVVMANTVYKNADQPIETLAEILGKCSTVDLQISFLRPGRGEHFTAKAWLLKGGNKISFTRMELYNDKESLIASGSGTYTHP